MFKYRLMAPMDGDGGEGETGGEAPADDLRSMLEQAVEQHEPAPEGEQAPAGDQQAEVDRGDGRTPRGRFAAKAPQEAATPRKAQTDPSLHPDARSVPADAQRPAQDPYARAPQAWKPGAREMWSQLPPDVRAEVYRREQETAQVLQETAQARATHDYAVQLGQRYAPALQAEGVDVGTAAANLFETASRLRFGSPVEKAQIAASIIQAYGIDVEALAYVIEGSIGRAPQVAQQQVYQDPRVDQLLAQVNQANQQRAQARQARANDEVGAFGAEHEFFEDVREEMADMIELADKRGVDLTLEQAYERACSMHPEISKIVQQRAGAAQAGTRGSTQRARAAAVSVRGTPAGESTSGQPDTIRGAIEAAIEANER